MPAELGSSAIILRLLADDKCVPSLVDQGLVQETIDHPRVHPVTLGHTRLEVAGDVLNMALASRVKSRAEAAGPVLALSKELDHLFGVGTRLAAVALLVVLVERVGTPEASVATRLGAGVLAPALVELVLVALPVVLALEARLTRGTPVNVGLSGGADWSTNGAKWSANRVGWRERERRLRSGAVGG